MKSNFCFAPRSGKTLERHLRGSCGNLPAHFSLFITRPAAVPNEPEASPSLAYFHGFRATTDTHYQPAIKLAAVACPASSFFFFLLPDAPSQRFYSISNSLRFEGISPVVVTRLLVAALCGGEGRTLEGRIKVETIHLNYLSYRAEMEIAGSRRVCGDTKGTSSSVRLGSLQRERRQPSPFIPGVVAAVALTVTGVLEIISVGL